MSTTQDPSEVDERLLVLESKLAYQDQTIEELNAVVTRQQTELDLITAVVRKLEEAAESMPDQGVEAGEEPPPPHY